jgi:hypothetical protein
MFEVQPPGSFPLSVDPAFQADAVRDLEQVSRMVREATRPFPVLGLILTGSVARGEGTLIADAEAGTRWLGDLDCVLVAPSGWRTPAREIDDAILQVVSQLNNDPANRRRGLKLGLNRMPASRLARLRQSIFNRELLEHAKLLWGTPAALPTPSWWTAGVREVPLRDAFRLLNNRIMQQVIARTSQETGDAEPLSTEYRLGKFWIELATSLSVFLGCYRTTYRERQSAFEALLTARPEIFGAEFSQLLVSRLREAMAVKFGQSPRVLTPPGRWFNEAARVARRVWFWESARMLDANPLGTNSDDANPDDTDWRLVISRLRRLETGRQRARDWMRLLIRDRALRRLTPYAVSTLRAALSAGSRANAIYASGSLLEFFWEEIGLETEPGPQIARTLGTFLNVRTGSGPARRLMLARSAQAAWEQHLHFSPA